MKTDVKADAGPRIAPAPAFWYRDPISCLQSTLGMIVAHAGGDPLAVMGAGWRFLHIPGDVRSEEFYYPCLPDAEGTMDLGKALAPHHGLHTRWRQPADAEAPFREIKEALAEGRLAIAAVDNFYLPFRPAYQDVHAAHLVIIYGLDEAREEIHVADSMPPAFQGAIPLEDFVRSWSSPNPADVQDAFFSDSRIDKRGLDVRLDRVPEPLTPEALGACMRTDNDIFTSRKSERSGLAGVETFTAELVDQTRSGDTAALRALYSFGWGMQAQAALHGELLRRCGNDWGDPELAGAGRAVEAVSYAWTALRMTGAHGHSDPRGVAADIARHAAVLRGKYALAVDAISRVGARI